MCSGVLVVRQLVVFQSLKEEEEMSQFRIGAGGERRLILAR